MEAKRILIVDDNRDGADALAMLLHVEGYTVRACYDGGAALEQAAAFQPHIVILDIMMPRLTGFEAARVFRRHPDSTRPRLIAVSGATDESTKVRAEMAGFDHYLPKPVDSAAVLRLLKSVQ